MGSPAAEPAGGLRADPWPAGACSRWSLATSSCISWSPREFGMSRVFFTADTHFGHSGIIGMCNRPFENIEHHDRALIENWNAVVEPDDTVWFLGDFAYRTRPQNIRRIFDMLNGTKHLICGNHDHGKP